mmetsp:Transcript_34432/g.83792  ORF Transcript_34432/g.83792 Transcript_34432/m.83792 type:complete len:216 (+) Transcript_34432:633-1280(+)
MMAVVPFITISLGGVCRLLSSSVKTRSSSRLPISRGRAPRGLPVRLSCVRLVTYPTSAGRASRRLSRQMRVLSEVRPPMAAGRLSRRLLERWISRRAPRVPMVAGRALSLLSETLRMRRSVSFPMTGMSVSSRLCSSDSWRRAPSWRMAAWIEVRRLLSMLRLVRLMSDWMAPGMVDIWLSATLRSCSSTWTQTSVGKKGSLSPPKSAFFVLRIT